MHCYRMLGNFDDAEDLVQETFVRAWRARSAFEGRSTFRAWLYRIATNACSTRSRPRSGGSRSSMSVPLQIGRRRSTRCPGFNPSPTSSYPGWMNPMRRGGEGDHRTHFLAAVQHLPPRPRAVLILRDVLGWTANETADALDDTVPGVNSALQRARAPCRSLGSPDGWSGRRSSLRPRTNASSSALHGCACPRGRIRGD